MSTDIRTVRVQKGLSQDAAAALAGISGHRLARIERGGTAEQAEVDAILKALNKVKASDNSRVGKGRPNGSKPAATKRAPAKKAATKKATAAKKTTRKPRKTAAADSALLS